MSDTKAIAVMGATGAQGGGLVRAILDDPQGGFSARAIVRDPDSPKARALADLGAELAVGNADDPKSLKRALDGAHGAYFVTFFWEHFSPERERTQAQGMAQAAHSAGLAHAIWSTLEDTRLRVPLDDQRMPTLMGSYKVPHFDAKGESNRYFAELGVPTTFLLTSFYWDNLIHFGMAPKRGPDGRLVFSLPMGDRPLPGIAAEDIGRCAYGIFQGGERYLDRTLGIAGEHPTGAEMAAELARALGEPVDYRAIEPADYRALGFPGAEDLGNMFQYKRDFSTDFCGARDLALSRTLNPRLQDFRTWLQLNRERLPIQ
jgi:uncharacterized protein YbjT (DUF2867 family)